jgi:hypothetical protein
LFRSLGRAIGSKLIRSKKPAKKPRPAIPDAALPSILRRWRADQTPVCEMNLVLK